MSEKERSQWVEPETPSREALLAFVRKVEKKEAKQESRGFNLRLDLSELVLRILKRKGWSPQDLARAASMNESFIVDVLRGKANYTLDTIGKLFHALGVMPSLQEIPMKGGIMGKIDNKKSYMGVVALGIIALLANYGVIDGDSSHVKAIASAIGIFTGVSFRHAIAKATKK